MKSDDMSLAKEEIVDKEGPAFIHPHMTKCGLCKHGLVRVIERVLQKPKKGAEPKTQTFFGGVEYAPEDADSVARRWMTTFCSHPRMQTLEGGQDAHVVNDVVLTCQGFERREEAS